MVKRIVKAETAQPAAMYMNEVQTLQALQGTHPNIVKLFDIKDSEDKLELLFEYCEEGSLTVFLERASRRGERARRQRLPALWDETLSALCYLHSQRYAHLDVKTDNVLVATAGARLCDFGTCLRVGIQHVAGNFGTEGFKAPEVGKPGGFDAFLADVYSTGRVLEAVLAIEGGIVAPLQFLVDMMVSQDPSERPVMQTVRVMSA